jgi:phospholipase C
MTMTINSIRRTARLVSLATAATVAAGLALPGLASEPAAATPIKHVIVIFQENVSFDHYFGTYPFAANNTPGEPVFRAAEGTPAINGLLTGPAAPPNNPTLNVAGTGTIQPFRLGRNQATTCDEDHNYTDECERWLRETGLHRSPRAVPILCLDAESDPSAAELAGHGRLHGSGEASI